MAINKAIDGNQLDADLLSIADAIRLKGGTLAELEFPDEFIAAINDIPQGGSGAVDHNDVNFYDYDGSIVAAYTAGEFAELTNMPSNPSHDGLEAQGWNWNLANAKTYVSKYGKLNIGQMYITDDRKTRIYVHMEKGRLHPYLGICPNGSVVVDWGDGSATDTISGTSLSSVQVQDHVYASSGDYVITLEVLSGSFRFNGSSNSGMAYILRKGNITTANVNTVYANCIKRVEIGANAIFGSSSFAYCNSLSSITIPAGATDNTGIGNYAFYCCRNLLSVTIPNGVRNIGTNVFGTCSGLLSVCIPDGVTSIGANAFSSCPSLSSLTIPEGITTIAQNMVAYCYKLSSVIIPETVGSIGTYGLSGCYNLSSVTIPNGVTSIGISAFSNCTALSSITIPEGVTSIGNSAFSYCHDLSSVTISEGVTSASIGQSTFNSCYGLPSITIPDRVTSIGAGAFGDCYGVGEYHFKRTTPPTLANTSAFSNIQSECIIYVPQGSLEAYRTATNWSTYASYMQEEAA